MHKKALVFMLLVTVAILVNGCARSEETALVMGFVPMRDAEALIESVEPLAELLSQELQMKVKPFTAVNYVAVVEGLGSGQVDFGFIPPFGYVLANSESNAQVILTALRSDGSPYYRSQFLVGKDSGIHNLEDLRGKKIAFVDPASTSGYLFPGAHLMRLGIDIDTDIEAIFAGNHDGALQALLRGEVDAAAVFVDARERYADDFPTAMVDTEVLAYTEFIPNISVTVKGAMPTELADKIAEALLKIASDPVGGPLLQELFNMYGFVRAQDSDYDIIRETALYMNVDLRNAP